MDKLDEVLANNTVSEDIRRMINSLSRDGREALNSIYDESSDFWKHAHPIKIANKFFANPKKWVNLYHYTDQNGLEGILKSHTFRIGSQYFMNDPEENIYVLKLAKEILKKQELASIEEIKFFKNDFQRVKFDNYIWSFTANDHSQALLRYGDFALKFNNQELQENLARYFNPNINDLSEFSDGNCYTFPLKVEYDLKTQKEYIGSVIHTWLGAYRNLRIDPDDMYEIMEDCYYALNLFAMCFKNPVLRQEEEIRFILLKRNGDNKMHPDKYIGNRPVLLFKFQPKLLKKVIYSKQVKDIEKLKNFLSTTGYTDTAVVPTVLPY